MHRTPLTVAATVLAVLTLAGCSTPAPPAAQTPTPSATATAPPTPAVEVPITSATLGPVAPIVPPTRVRIAATGVDIPVIPVGLFDDGFMELPDDPAVAGWYRFGPAPASTAGNTVISAHVDAPGYGIGPFASLRDVPAGTEVVVEAEDGTTTRWATESVTYYLKADLPVEQLFSRIGPPGLVLITCGGEFDASIGHYTDNVVLVARPIA